MTALEQDITPTSHHDKNNLFYILNIVGNGVYNSIGWGLKITAGVLGSALGFMAAGCLGRRLAVPMLASATFIAPSPVTSGILFFLQTGAFHGWYLGIYAAKTVYSGISKLGEWGKDIYTQRNTKNNKADTPTNLSTATPDVIITVQEEETISPLNDLNNSDAKKVGLQAYFARQLALSKALRRGHGKMPGINYFDVEVVPIHSPIVRRNTSSNNKMLPGGSVLRL